MKRFYIALVFFFFGSVISVEARTAGDPGFKPTGEQQKAYNDLEAITELRETVRNDDRFYQLQGTAPYLELDKYEEFYKLIKDVEDNFLPGVNRKLDKWAKVYGSTIEEQKASYNRIYATIPTNEVSYDKFWGTELFASHYSDIKEMISNVSKTHDACVGELLSKVNTSLNTISAVLPDYRVPIYEKSLKTLDLVLMFDPKNKDAEKLIETIKKDSKSAMKEKDNQVDEGKWPGQFKKFNGPGSVNGLSEKALDWFKNDTKGWAEANPLLVAVKGDWISAKKNIFDETIQWGLPIYLAAHKKKDTDIVRVFSLTLLTQEEKGIKKLPPFTGAWVGDNFDMRMKNLPGSSSSKTPFFLWRLMLSLSLLALGAAAVSQKLGLLNSKFKIFTDELAYYKGHIGVCASILGILFFLNNLMLIAPFSDILPQLFAVLAGIISGAKIFEKETKDMKFPKLLSGAVQKIHGLFANNSEKLEKMKAFEVPLGLVCLVLGFLHLIAGGLILF